MWKLGLLCCLAALLAGAYAQATPPANEATCNSFSSSCQNCIDEGRNSSLPSLNCYWCAANNVSMRCRHFNFNTAIPISGQIPCPELRYNFGTCALDALGIIIIIAVTLLVLVVLICAFCCCCCIWCSRRRKMGRMVEEQRHMEEKDAIRQKSAERRQERKAKHDEIRRKYGLYHDDPAGGTYKRLD